MAREEQVQPLAPGSSLRWTSPEIAAGPGKEGADVESARIQKRSRRRRLAVRCCACCGVAAVAFGILVLVLALTVFKVKDPILTLNALAIDDLHMGVAEQEGRPVSLNATVTADISIENPNAASFRFQNSTTEFYHRGETVGVAYAPSGRVGAERTVRMNVTVDVYAERVASLVGAYPNATAAEVLLGRGISVDLSSYTEVRGRVSVWGIYSRHIDVRTNCTMTLEYALLSRQEITNKVCRATVG